MKNIIIVSGAPIVYGNSAATARMNNYAKALANSQDVYVYLFSQKYLYKESEIVQIHRNVFTVNKPAIEKSRSIMNVLGFVKQVRHFCEKLNGETIYLFYPASNPIVEMVFLLFNKIFSKTKIYCEINEVRKYASSIKRFSFFRRVITLLSCFVMDNFVKLYDGIICISKNIEGYYIVRNSNSIILPILSDIPDTLLVRKEKSDINKYVFTGSISVDKENLEELLKGFALLDVKSKNWMLLLYGKCSRVERIRIEKLAKENGIFDKVFLNGEIAHSEISTILSLADCLILPRKNTKQNYYGFSTKLSEYAVSGTPIILTDTGVVRDYFCDGINCLLTEGYDAPDFYKKIVEFEAMSDIQKENMGQSAFETAKEMFDWKKYSIILNNFLK